MQNMKLTEEFSFEEFTMAIKQMHLDKVSGPDGLNPAFFRVSDRLWCKRYSNFTKNGFGLNVFQVNTIAQM